MQAATVLFLVTDPSTNLFHPIRSTNSSSPLGDRGASTPAKEIAYERATFRAEVHEDERSHRGAPRAHTAEDPRRRSDRAIEDWLQFARELDCPNIQISTALHPSESDVPPEAMLDPVANTLDSTKPFDKQRAKRVLAAMDATGVGATDIAFFDNLLHDDNDLRKKKHEFVLRLMDAAALLGLKAVCGFIGRNQKLTMDQNLLFFEEVFIPLLKEAKARGLEYRNEQCPMPGWTVGDNFHNNIGYAPGCGSRFTAFAKSTAWAINPACTTILRTRS